MFRGPVPGEEPRGQGGEGRGGQDPGGAVLLRAQEPGARVVIARSAEGNRELQAKLSRLGVLSTGVETIEFADPANWDEVDAAVKAVGSFDWLAFTSPRAVAVFAERMKKAGATPKPGRPLVAAVGSRTAEAVRACGFDVDFVPAEFLTAALGEGLPSGKGRKVILLRADIGDESLVTALRDRGFDVTNVVAYRTRPIGGQMDEKGITAAHWIAFASPSEVRGFKARIPEPRFGAICGEATAVCIGPVTARAAKAAGFNSVVSCEEHTVDALAETIRRLAADA